MAKFRVYRDATAIRHVFHAPLTVALDELILGEGWDMGLLTIADIRSGTHYSPVAQASRPIGPIHQQILTEFAATIQ